MYRMLVALAGVVVLLTVGGVIGVMCLNRGDSRPAGGPDSAAPPTGGGSGPEAPASATVTGDNAPDREMLPEVDDDPEPKAGADAPAKAPVSAEAPVADDLALADVKARIGALLDGLSEDELQELHKQAQARRMRQWREESKYQLRSDGRLQILRWGRNEALKLNEAQELKIAEFQEIMKSKTDEALSSVWAQEEGLRGRARALAAKGLNDEVRTIHGQLIQLQKETAEIKQQLDGEYKQFLRGILTPDQMAAVERSAYGRPRGRNQP